MTERTPQSANMPIHTAIGPMWKVLTRKMILDKLWDGAGNFVDDNTLSVYVRRLREKLEENPSLPKYLLTVRGLGYQWKE